MAAKRKKGGKKNSAAATYKSKVGLKTLLIILLVIVIIAILAFAAYKAGLIPQKYIDYIKYEILKIEREEDKYGTLSINDIEFEYDGTATAEPVFSKSNRAEDITYIYDDGNLVFSGNTVSYKTSVSENKVISVTAKTAHLETGFKVTVKPINYGTLVVENKNKLTLQQGKRKTINLNFSNPERSEDLTFDFKDNYFSIDKVDNKYVIEAIEITGEEGIEVTAKSEHFEVTFVVVITEDDSIVMDSTASEELEIYFPELQSYYTGDCTLIKVGNVEVLIDAGSKTSCVATVDDFIKTKCTDGKLEYVIVTHAHEDHYAGFATSSNVKSIFDRYEIGTIIDFAQITNDPKSPKSEQAMYKNYQRELSEAVTAGAVHYTAKEARESENYIFKLSETVSLTIIDSYYYYNVSTTENDHSVCTLLTQTCADGKERNFLFTGDLEKKGESWIAANDDLPEVELFKAGHHGSKTSSNSDLLAVIKPKIVCVCCCAGTSEYTPKQENQFPTQEFINRISVWTARVYVTTVVVDDKAKTFESMNGTITVISFENKITINGSDNNTVLKDTDWFKKNRTCPENWAS